MNPASWSPGVWLSVLMIGVSASAVSGQDDATVALRAREVLAKSCYPCHGPDESHRAAGLRLDTPEGRVDILPSGRTAVTPGDRSGSALWARVSHPDLAHRMPPSESGSSLTAEDLDALGRWIDAGAPYVGHWAFAAPENPVIPSVADGAWVQNPLDAFVLAALEREGLGPAAPAERSTLLRRLSLDIIGLPPTPSEVSDFQSDADPRAVERVVDRLLASPHFGERMAAAWLDLARYADSTGYASDPPREIWRWRDWVIDAFNRNMPFDQFTVEQIAGDLLPHGTDDQILATAFQRNTMTNTEGGTDDEEFRVAAVKDRLETTFSTWMGLTVGCAECHSHKFDPITHEDYYRLFAFFNQTADTDQPNDEPRLVIPTATQREAEAALTARMAALESELRSPPVVGDGSASWVQSFEQDEAAWRPWLPEESSSEAQTLTRSPDGSILVAGAHESGAPERYVLQGPLPSAGTQALRLEALTSGSDENPEGPGCSPNGNFVLSEIQVHTVPRGPRQVRGRYVRVELRGKDRILSLAEVEVLAGSDNVAVGGTARQSSVGFGGEPVRAADGNRSGRFEDASVTHTQTEADPWWELDLGQEIPIDGLHLWNRSDGTLGQRLAGAVVRVLDARREESWSSALPDVPGKDGFRFDLNLGPRWLQLGPPTATFSQENWDVEAAVDGQVVASSGWAIAPKTKRNHEAVFPLVPLPVGEDRLFVTLHQRFGSHHHLGRFRLAFTDRAHRVAVPQEVRDALVVPPTERTQLHLKQIAGFAWRSSPERGPIREQLAQLRKQRDEMMFASAPVMRELPVGKRRVTRLLMKGNFLTPGEVVEPGVPSFAHGFPQDVPGDRLGLARWITSDDNPLFARVFVNRVWGLLFGKGLVETQEDFGTTGSLPTHPELLDWLAITFRESGYDVKSLVKTIVLSATYGQGNAVSAEALTQDPANRWWSHAPRVRLDAETVRDQALSVSGLLVSKMGGPSVFPSQPAGLWQAAFDDRNRRWVTSPGEDRYRRGLYTFLRRTIPYPSLTLFDLPGREVCSQRRIRTNTPLQALVTLNDPAFVEAAQALGRRMLLEAGPDDSERLRFGFVVTLARAPDGEEVRALEGLVRAERARQEADPHGALRVATDPLGPLPSGLSPVEGATWTVVANVLLNLDEFLVRP